MLRSNIGLAKLRSLKFPPPKRTFHVLLDVGVRELQQVHQCNRYNSNYEERFSPDGR